VKDLFCRKLDVCYEKILFNTIPSFYKIDPSRGAQDDKIKRLFLKFRQKKNAQDFFEKVS
jgi:hypothetical protein